MMILTAITLECIPIALYVFSNHISLEKSAKVVFERICASREWLSCGGNVRGNCAAAALAEAFEIPLCDEEPARAFSWDGRVLRYRSEASVVVHEVAHYLVAAPERRFMLDFGLGAGPESGRVAEADAALAADDETRESEEALSSLLGILWEVELGLSGFPAFLEQNWLEGYERPSAAHHFVRCLRLLAERGLIDADGHPTPPATLLPGLRRDRQNHCPIIAQDKTVR